MSVDLGLPLLIVVLMLVVVVIGVVLWVRAREAWRDWIRRYVTILFLGLAGYLLMKVGCEPAPLLLGFVLGPMMEENLRRALLISRGDPSVFFTRPISLAFMIGTLLILIVMVAPVVRRNRVTTE